MIYGKVARILNDTEFILNVGYEDEVEEDMEFVIFSEGEHVLDPETGDDLGPIETVKGRVKIYYVQKKMSRAKTLSYKVQVTTPSFAEMIESVSFRTGSSRVETRRHKLNVQKDEIKPIDEDLSVRVGDSVRSV